MPKPVCVACQCFLHPETNGFALIEGMPNGTGDPAVNIRGKRAPEAWKPYKVWLGDRWECPDCGLQIVTGFGQGPVAEHYQPDFDAQVKAHGAKLMVNDC